MLLVVACLLASGCLEAGRPVIRDQSTEVTPPKRSDAAYRRSSQPRKSLPSASVPVVHRGTLPKQILVQPGDTLYRIAWRFGLTFEQLAQFNRLRPPYVIFPGQRLNVSGAESINPSTIAAADPGSSVKSPVAQPSSASPKTSQTQTPQQALPRGAWRWPVPVAPSRGFSAQSKGLDFQLAQRAGVAATQAGQVVYAGNGIGGFERLIIIKHAASLLSAYSFNGTSEVAEQTDVKAGQKIADIRGTGHKPQLLHFELRRSGKPVDPAGWLQPR